MSIASSYLKITKEKHGVYVASYGYGNSAVRTCPLEAARMAVHHAIEWYAKHIQQTYDDDTALAVMMTGSYAGAADLLGQSENRIRAAMRGQTPDTNAAHLRPKKKSPGSPLNARAALDNQTGHREHAHRSLMQDGMPDFDLSLGETFWPTRRDYAPPPRLSPINYRCQRCGTLVLPTAGWWCRDCSNIARLQQERGEASMMAIAASGEYDPPDCPHAAWLFPSGDRRTGASSQVRAMGSDTSLQQRATAFTIRKRFGSRKDRDRLDSNYRTARYTPRTQEASDRV